MLDVRTHPALKKNAVALAEIFVPDPEEKDLQIDEDEEMNSIKCKENIEID